MFAFVFKAGKIGKRVTTWNNAPPPPLSPSPLPVNILNNVTGNSRWPTIPAPILHGIELFRENNWNRWVDRRGYHRRRTISRPDRSFLASLLSSKKQKKSHAETGFLPQLFHRSIPQFFGTVQFLVLSYLASLIIYRGNAWCFSPACKRNRIPRSKEEPIHRVNKRRRGVASEEAGWNCGSGITSFLRDIVCTQGIGAPELRCLSSSVDGAESQGRSSSCFLAHNGECIVHRLRARKRENIVSPFSLGKHARMHAYA